MRTRTEGSTSIHAARAGLVFWGTQRGEGGIENQLTIPPNVKETRRLPPFPPNRGRRFLVNKLGNPAT